MDLGDLARMITVLLRCLHSGSRLDSDLAPLSEV
jgi:hypothetical protein